MLIRLCKVLCGVSDRRPSEIPSFFTFVYLISSTHSFWGINDSTVILLLGLEVIEEDRTFL